MRPNPYANCDAEHKAMLDPLIGQTVDLYDASGNAPRAYSDMTPTDAPTGPWVGTLILVGTITVPALIGFLVGLIVGGSL